jgi:hypothetical protein
MFRRTSCFYPEKISFLILSLLWLLRPVAVHAELRELTFYRREPFAQGKSFGPAGPYEVLAGVARFAVDPDHPANRGIVDLARAPRNAQGQVEFEADVFLLAPRLPERGNGALLYEVNNRGNKLALYFFNEAPRTNNPSQVGDAGNGFLFQRGYTLVWSGWIGELLPGDQRLLLRAPLAQEHGRPIRGRVRCEMSTDRPATVLPLANREGHGSYPPSSEGEKQATLTWRMREGDERVPIPRAQWRLERLPLPPAPQGVPGTLPPLRLHLAGGFRPGYLYELIYEAEGPLVQGLGFAAVRDLVSFLRYDPSARNPLRRQDGRPAIQRTHAFGVSQSGRFLRDFLYQGFNGDEAGRRVFDGVWSHVAGGGLGFINFRFAQPTRHNAQHEEHLYPTDRFPFTYGESTDPFSGRTDGLLRRLRQQNPQLLPRVFHTQTAAEYWHRSGSLVHTDPLGKEDVPLPAEVRLYVFGGTQHVPAPWPPPHTLGDQPANPADYRPFLRALLEALDAWVRAGVPPPPSVYPRISAGTLVDWRQQATGFPALPGVRYPEVIQQPPAADYGPRFLEGILTQEPPRLRGHYVVRVPRSDADGNDLGTLLPPEVAVPLATYTGWNLRRRQVGAEAMLVALMGSYLPFPRRRADRLASGDPRLSLEERYGSFAEYQRRFEATCQDLVRRRYLLPEDLPRLRQRLEAVRDGFAFSSASSEPPGR